MESGLWRHLSCATTLSSLSAAVTSAAGQEERLGRLCLSRRTCTCTSESWMIAYAVVAATSALDNTSLLGARLHAAQEDFPCVLLTPFLKRIVGVLGTRALLIFSQRDITTTQRAHTSERESVPSEKHCATSELNVFGSGVKFVSDIDHWDGPVQGCSKTTFPLSAPSP